MKRENQRESGGPSALAAMIERMLNCPAVARSNRAWAKQLGVDPRAISLWLTDKAIPSPGALCAIVDTLQVKDSVPPDLIRDFQLMASRPASEVSPLGTVIGTSVQDYMSPESAMHFPERLRELPPKVQRRALLGIVDAEVAPFSVFNDNGTAARCERYAAAARNVSNLHPTAYFLGCWERADWVAERVRAACQKNRKRSFELVTSDCVSSDLDAVERQIRACSFAIIDATKPKELSSEVAARYGSELGLMHAERTPVLVLRAKTRPLIHLQLPGMGGVSAYDDDSGGGEIATSVRTWLEGKPAIHGVYRSLSCRTQLRRIEHGLREWGVSDFRKFTPIIRLLVETVSDVMIGIQSVAEDRSYTFEPLRRAQTVDRLFQGAAAELRDNDEYWTVSTQEFWASLEYGRGSSFHSYMRATERRVLVRRLFLIRDNDELVAPAYLAFVKAELESASPKDYQVRCLRASDQQAVLSGDSSPSQYSHLKDRYHRGIFVQHRRGEDRFLALRPVYDALGLKGIEYSSDQERVGVLYREMTAWWKTAGLETHAQGRRLFRLRT